MEEERKGTDERSGEGSVLVGHFVGPIINNWRNNTWTVNLGPVLII